MLVFSSVTFRLLTYRIALVKPADDAEAVGDPYKTLFISRLVSVSLMQCYSVLISQAQHKSATENDLRREFETFGTIERVRIVRDKKNRGRGYAFIVYERERDMKGTFVFILVLNISAHTPSAAYKESDGLHIMGKRILVDVERGRTVRGWKPRRLGGGLGGRPKAAIVCDLGFELLKMWRLVIITDSEAVFREFIRKYRPSWT